jgi:hypothetical protein
MENLIPNQPLTGIFQTLSSLSLSDLDQVMKQVIGLRKQKLPGVLSQAEADLLKKINTPIPLEIQQRYNYLIDLRKQEKLTDDEYQELLELTTFTENLNIKRLENLLQLAKLRNISLDDLIEQLELKPQLNVA